MCMTFHTCSYLFCVLILTEPMHVSGQLKPENLYFRFLHTCCDFQGSFFPFPGTAGLTCVPSGSVHYFH